MNILAICINEFRGIMSRSQNNEKNHDSNTVSFYDRIHEESKAMLKSINDIQVFSSMRDAIKTLCSSKKLKYDLVIHPFCMNSAYCEDDLSEDSSTSPFGYTISLETIDKIIKTNPTIKILIYTGADECIRAMAHTHFKNRLIWLVKSNEITDDKIAIEREIEVLKVGQS